jgi:GT2 family glycosyltransferase/glycosyltransferase involved in cell wall biosynthesis/SAM-dependent methyltransferase
VAATPIPADDDVPGIVSVQAATTPGAEPNGAGNVAGNIRDVANGATEVVTDAPPESVGAGPLGLLMQANGAALLLLPREAAADQYEVQVGGTIFLASSGVHEPADRMLNANQLLNGDFSDELEHWRPTRKVVGWEFDLDHEGWHLAGGHTAYIRQDAAKVAGAMEIAYVSGQPDGLLPLRQGATYQFSGLFALHRCTGEVLLRVLAPDGRLLQEVIGRPSPDAKGGARAEDYTTVLVHVQAPDEPCAAQLVLRKGTTHVGGSWMFFTSLWFGRVNNRTRMMPHAQPYSDSAMRAMQLLDVGGIEAWQLPLPDARFGAEATVIEAVERATGRHVTGSPLLLLDAPWQAAGAITGIEGTSVVGWVADTTRPDMALSVCLFVDGASYQTVLADQPHGANFNGFRFVLPASVLDGQAHRIAVRLAENGILVGETAEMLPSALTPWSSIARYGGLNLPARLSTAASYRYEALRAHARAQAEIAKAPADEQRWRAVLFGQSFDAHERVLIGLDRTPNLHPLAFPVIEKPKVSIVIPVHNKLAVTHNCLAALILAYNKASFEVIVVDDGSTDGTTELSALVSGIRVCRHEKAEGFVAACNLGAAEARGDYIVLLNNDTEPTAFWLDELVFVFDGFDRVGLVGSKLLYPDGKLQEAGGIIWGDGSPWNYGRLGNPAEPRFSYTRQADYLSGAAMMAPRSLWQELGGLSEEFRPAYYEDTDFCFKVRRAGYRTVYAANSIVFHFEGISSGTSTASGMKRFQEVNRPKFLRKWRNEYRGHGTDHASADLEKDRGTVLRALFIDAEPPRPDTNAGSYAAIQEMRAMQALGAKVTFLPENLAYLGAYMHDLQRAGIETMYAPFVYSVEEFLARRGNEFDIVYITRYMVAARHIEAVRRFAPQAKILFCNADLHFLRELRQAIAGADQQEITAALATRDAELRIMREVDVTLSYSEVEHAVILSHNLNSTTVAVCPWIVSVAEQVPGFADRADVAFLGGFGHPPNLAAVNYFVREVMPLLRRSGVELRFLVYGSGAPPELEDLECDDVIIKGYVENVAAVYETCRVFVAPLMSGAGMKGKVVDALSYGVPCVLSPVAAEGIGLSEGGEAMVARTPRDWCSAVLDLYNNEILWNKVSQRAQEFTRRRFSFERGVDQMRAAVEAAGLFPHEGMALQKTSARL